MTPAEFRPTAALLDNACKDDFDSHREMAYAAVLARYDADDVYAAVVELLGGPGGAWVPSTAEIAAAVKLVRRVGTPDWAFEQLSELVDAVVRYSNAGYEALCSRRLRGEHLAEQITNLHPVYGPALATAVASMPLYLVTNRQTGVWDTEIVPAYMAATRPELLADPTAKRQLNP